ESTQSDDGPGLSPGGGRGRAVRLGSALSGRARGRVPVWGSALDGSVLFGVSTQGAVGVEPVAVSQYSDECYGWRDQYCAGPQGTDAYPQPSGCGWRTRCGARSGSAAGKTCVSGNCLWGGRAVSTVVRNPWAASCPLPAWLW